MLHSTTKEPLSIRGVILHTLSIIAITLVLLQPNLASAEGAETSEIATTAVEKALEKTLNPRKDIKEPELFNIIAATTERALGDPKAPITVIEYASMTCPHCAEFHSNTFSKVKKQYIDTGKVYWVLREFPLDKLALRASMMARCVTPSLYFNLIEVLFSSQSRWIGADDPMKSLEQTGRLVGMSPELFKECTNNTDLEMHVLKNMQTGQNQWNVKATPTFIINYGEERASGTVKIEEFKEIFDKLLQKHGAE